MTCGWILRYDIYYLLNLLYFIFKKHNYWNIPNDAPKKETLKVCNKSWRAYKSTLVTDFMDNDLDASTFYPYLTKELWEDFVKLKSTKEFQVFFGL
uniref:Uncharacterized protein n=1 Tax=Lactuca sativa TaxID=4236 RepID=A0A9R1VI61_LACSA|nr:hypothetical protein LSAT_V11C500256540 [Lactuca sativa]